MNATIHSPRLTSLQLSTISVSSARLDSSGAVQQVSAAHVTGPDADVPGEQRFMSLGDGRRGKILLTKIAI